jgi:hypothetical protein
MHFYIDKKSKSNHRSLMVYCVFRMGGSLFCHPSPPPPLFSAPIEGAGEMARCALCSLALSKSKPQTTTAFRDDRCPLPVC